jgi:hypothetical protein
LPTVISDRREYLFHVRKNMQYLLETFTDVALRSGMMVLDNHILGLGLQNVTLELVFIGALHYEMRSESSDQTMDGVDGDYLSRQKLLCLDDDSINGYWSKGDGDRHGNGRTKCRSKTTRKES